MKIYLLIGLILSFNSLSSEQYIIKTNHSFNKNTINHLDISKELKLSFGTYQIIKTDKKFNHKEINKLSQLKGVEYVEMDHILKTQDIRKSKNEKSKAAADIRTQEK